MSFEQAVEYVRNQPKVESDNTTRLAFYKFYKQGTTGDCDTPQPRFYDLVASAKWKAWQSIKGMAPEEAQKKYIKLLAEKVPDWEKSIQG